MYSNRVDLVINPEYAQKQVDLVNSGYQSKTRAIMALYDVTRDEAEEILKEINQERSSDSSNRFGDYSNFDASLND